MAYKPLLWLKRGLAGLSLWMRERLANWLLAGTHIRKPCWFGPHSISLNGGILDFNTTVAPTEKGQLGMDVSTGLPSCYTTAVKTLALAEDVGGGGSFTVVAKTSNYPVVSGDVGKVFTNEGASGTVTFTLPAAAAGLHFYFVAQASQVITLTAASGDTIKVGFTTSSAGGSLSSSGTSDDWVRLIAINATEWVAIPYEGSWF